MQANRRVITHSIVRAIKDEFVLKWDKPFTITMGDIRKLMIKYSFRLNHILLFLRHSEVDGYAKRLLIPKGDEAVDVVIARFSRGISEDYFQSHVAIFLRVSLLDSVVEFMRHVEPDSYNPLQLSIPMLLCRCWYSDYGFTYDEFHQLFRKLQKDGYVEILKRPSESVGDDEIIATLTKLIPNEYHQENREHWKLIA